MRRDARPYLEPWSNPPRFEPWEMCDGPGWTPLVDQVDGWDPQTDLTLRRTVVADWADLRVQTGLPDRSRLVVTGSWESSTSTMRGRFAQAEAPYEPGELELGGTVPGRLIGGRLELRTTVAVAGDWTAPVGVAGRAGSVLAEDRYRVRLEGTGSLFPVAVVDFTHTAYDVDASWHLQGGTDPHAPFLGTFLLSVNSRDTDLTRAITTARPGAAHQMLLAETQHQVAQQLIEMALDVHNVHDLLGSRWPSDSVGDVLRGILSAAGGDPPTETADRRAWLAGAARRLAQGRVFT